MATASERSSGGTPAYSGPEPFLPVPCCSRARCVLQLAVALFASLHQALSDSASPSAAIFMMLTAAYFGWKNG